MSKARKLNQLPFWTWIVPLILFVFGRWVSIAFNAYFGSSIFYLPMAFGFVLIHWWGPRVLTPLFISSLFFDFPNEFNFVSLLGLTHLVLCVFISWVLFRKAGRGDCRLESLADLLKFILLGLLIPVAINALYYPFFLELEGNALANYWEHVMFLWVADFNTSFSIAIPVLYFVTPVMDRFKLTLRYSLSPLMTPHKSLERLFTGDVLVVLSLLVGLSFSVDFETYWSLYGVCMLYLSVRHGFEVALFGNLTIFLLVYIMPYLVKYPLDYTALQGNSLAVLHLGMSLVYVASAIVGRTVSDLKHSELLMMNKNKMLEITNDELSKVNGELDRFVYSVSHDLTAPLKTIKGLVNISRMESDPERVKSYVNMIDNRVDKLETFIGEVIDFSKSSRREIRFEKINLQNLADEILEIHIDPQRDANLEIIRNLRIETVVSDPMLLRIILNNIISNAIKYSRKDERTNHFVSISSDETNEGICISVADNGEGIQEDIQHKIFNMFFRGTMNSGGSGLGLYIAKEAIGRIQGKITLRSTLGQGSEFNIHLPLRSV